MFNTLIPIEWVNPPPTNPTQPRIGNIILLPFPKTNKLQQQSLHDPRRSVWVVWSDVFAWQAKLPSRLLARDISVFLAMWRQNVLSNVAMWRQRVIGNVTSADYWQCDVSGLLAMWRQRVIGNVKSAVTGSVKSADYIGNVTSRTDTPHIFSVTLHLCTVLPEHLALVVTLTPWRKIYGTGIYKISFIHVYLYTYLEFIVHNVAVKSSFLRKGILPVQVTLKNPLLYIINPLTSFI